MGLSLRGHFEYLEVNGVDQHQYSELGDGFRGHDICDSAFGLIRYPFVDGHSGLLWIFLRKNGKQTYSPVFPGASPLPHAAGYCI